MALWHKEDKTPKVRFRDMKDSLESGSKIPKPWAKIVVVRGSGQNKGFFLPYLLMKQVVRRKAETIHPRGALVFTLYLPSKRSKGCYLNNGT